MSSEDNRIKLKDEKEEYELLKVKKGNELIRRTSGSVVEIQFDKIFREPEFEKLNKFVLNKKQSFLTNFNLVGSYINYFAENYDDDNELAMIYLRLKVLIDKKVQINQNTFIEELHETLLSDSMIEKVSQMTEDCYNITIVDKKTKNSKSALQFSDEHAKIILSVSTFIKMMTPLVAHYLSTYNMKKATKFIYHCFNVFRYVNPNVNIENKLQEFAFNRIEKRKNKDESHWNKVEILGKDKEFESEEMVEKLIADVLFKCAFDGNIMKLFTASFKKMVSWSVSDNFEKNLVLITDEKNDDGLSDFDKIEMEMAKTDESLITVSEINIDQTIRRLEIKWGVEYDRDELMFYVKNLIVSPFQKDLVFQLFASECRNIKALYTCDRIQYAKFIILMMRHLEEQGFMIFPLLLTGIVNGNNNKKFLNKKLNKRVEGSPEFKDILESYRFAYEILKKGKVFENYLETLLNSVITVNNYDAEELNGKPLNITENIDRICDEYIRFINLIRR